MKIKCLFAQGTFVYGEVIEATYSDVSKNAFAFDRNGSGWWFYIGQFEVVQDVNSESSGAKSFREFIGQDVSKLEVIFK